VAEATLKMSWSLFDQTAVSPLSWAQAELQSLGVPLTAANEQSLIAWALLEGGGGTYNPLNTSLPEPGSVKINSDGVQSYTSWDQGVQATTSTIDESYYTQILADLKAGSGIGTTPELSTWSGNGYDSLSGTWNEAGQYMSGQASPLPAGASGVSTASYNPLSILPGDLGSVVGSLVGKVFGATVGKAFTGDITDVLERGALMLFGAVLVVIGLLKITGNETKITLNQPVSEAPAAAAEAGEAGA
jgi:hypothetical protein